MARETRKIRWKFGEAEAQNLGAMIGPVEFLLPNGKKATPFQVAPWWQEEGLDDLPGILRALRGEWPCVPFGVDAKRSLLPPWDALAAKADYALHDPHGYGSNHEWQWGECDEGSIRLEIDYPKGHPIRRLSRSICAVPDAPEIRFELEVQARETCQLPIGLHGTFHLLGPHRNFELRPRGFREAWTYPGTVEAGLNLFAPNEKAHDLAKVPRFGGGNVDLRFLPLDEKVEDLLQLVAVDGAFELVNHSEGYVTEFQWDAEEFNSVLLWVSNGGRAYHPWNERHFAIGIEPISSAFDLGPAISNDPQNPMNLGGVRTSKSFEKGATFKTSYSVGVRPLTT